MTLIAGLKCVDGYVLCADSQETVRDKGLEYRVMRKKIAPIKHKDFEMAVAASGDGPTINAFIARIKKSNKTISYVDLDQISTWLYRELKAYLKEQQIRPKNINSSIRLNVGVWHKDGTGALWDTEGGEIAEIEDYSIIGFADFKYEYAVQQLYRDDLTIAQGIFLGLYVMSLAERTSNYVKGPISVVVVRNSGIHPQAPKVVTELDNRVQLFAAQFDKLLLSCPDTGLQHGQFADKVNEFVKTVVHLRQEYVEEMVGKKIEEGLDKVNDPYNLIPVGTSFVITPTQQQEESLRKMYEDGARNLRETVAYVQEWDTVIANLEALKSHYKKVLMQAQGGEAPTQEEQEIVKKAMQEIVWAALMGPCKVEPDVHKRLVCVLNVIPADAELGELSYPRMQYANNLVRLGIVEQTLAYMQRPKPSDAQTSAGQQ